MDNDKVRAVILKVPVIESLHGDLGEKVTDVIMDIGVVRRVAEGQTMTKEHRPGKNRGFVLLKGSINIEKDDAPPSVCRPPELLGEVMQFNPKGQRTATLTAIDECWVIRFQWNEFWTALMTNFSEAEVAKVRETLEDRAWEHFTG
jgi:hypothetical protein